MLATFLAAIELENVFQALVITVVFVLPTVRAILASRKKQREAEEQRQARRSATDETPEQDAERGSTAWEQLLRGEDSPAPESAAPPGEVPEVPEGTVPERNVLEELFGSPPDRLELPEAPEPVVVPASPPRVPRPMPPAVVPLEQMLELPSEDAAPELSSFGSTLLPSGTGRLGERTPLSSWSEEGGLISGDIESAELDEGLDALGAVRDAAGAVPETLVARSTWSRAIVLAEMLGPPLSMRDPQADALRAAGLRS